MSEELVSEDETDYSVSVFFGNNELCDSSLLNSKLGDTWQVSLVDFLESLNFIWK